MYFVWISKCHFSSLEMILLYIRITLGVVLKIIQSILAMCVHRDLDCEQT